MNPLESERIGLREFRLDDLDAVHGIVGDDRVTWFLSFDSRSREQAEDMLAGILERAQKDPRTEFYLAITPTGTDELIGFARLALGGVKAAKLGYAVAHEHQGKGYATDAVITMLRFAFGSLALHRVTAAIGPDNPASMAVIQRTGFTQEGVLRDHVHTNGVWRDSVLFSVLAHEWSGFRR